MADHFRLKCLFLISLAVVLLGGLFSGCQKAVPEQTTSSAGSSGKTNTTQSGSTTAKPTPTSPETETTTSAAKPSPAKTAITETTPGPETSTEELTEWRLTILYDNYLSVHDGVDPNLKTDWGFSCLIEGPESVVLFDTGADSNILLDNMRQLKLDPARIDAVVLSHNHNDHVGGLDGFLEKNPDVVVYLPASFPDSFYDQVRSFGAETVEISEASELTAGLYSTGEMGHELKEQSLILTTSEGLVVLTGCAHPGIVNIVRKASEIRPGEPVYLVLGGFHLAWSTTAHIKAVIDDLRQLGVINVAPSHCSGDESRRLFKKAYGDHYIESGAGKTVAFRAAP